nr:MAG TPA: hypothetical protein [Caudoviricetes sp.]
MLNCFLQLVQFTLLSCPTVPTFFNCFAGSCLFFTHSVCHSHSLTTMLLVCSPIASPSLSCLLCSVFEVDVLSTDIIIHDGR